MGLGCDKVLGTCTPGRFYATLSLLEVANIVDAMGHTGDAVVILNAQVPSILKKVVITLPSF